MSLWCRKGRKMDTLSLKYLFSFWFDSFSVSCHNWFWFILSGLIKNSVWLVWYENLFSFFLRGLMQELIFNLFWARTDFDFDSFWAVWCKNWLLVVWWNNVSGGDVRPQHWMRLLNNLEWTNKQTHFGRCWAMNNTESTNKQILVEISEQLTISTNT